MATYLLIWNPTRWKIRSTISEGFERVRDGWVTRWSAGRDESIVAADRVFMARVGRVDRGIFASGTAMDAPILGPHWNREEGDTTGRHKRLA